ncbi:hypothetical protein Esti_005098 [Eimeria stiedai]
MSEVTPLLSEKQGVDAFPRAAATTAAAATATATAETVAAAATAAAETSAAAVVTAASATAMEGPCLSVEDKPPVSDMKCGENSADTDLPGFPQVLRCTRGGRVVGRSNFEEAYGEASEAYGRQELLKALQGMTLQQKLSCCAQLKAKGNNHYAAAEYLPAIACYEQGLLALDFGSSREQEEDVRKQLLLPLLLNISACLLKLRRFAKASALCDVALREEPRCLKALYRRGLALKELGDLSAAKADFLRILTLCAVTTEEQQRQQQQQQQRQQQEMEELLQQEKAQPEPFQRRKDLVKEGNAAAKSAAAACRNSSESTCPPGPSSDPDALLVLLCRRELANVNQQQRRYSAACSRMIGGVRKRQQKPPAAAARKPDKPKEETLRVVQWTTAHKWIRLCAYKVVQWTTALSLISLRVCKKRDT